MTEFDDMTEFDEWAKRFEAHVDDRPNSEGSPRQVPGTCMYPIKEGLHSVACGVTATTRSADDYPSCERHENNRVRAAWRGYVEGA